MARTPGSFSHRGRSGEPDSNSLALKAPLLNKEGSLKNNGYAATHCGEVHLVGPGTKQHTEPGPRASFATGQRATPRFPYVGGKAASG